MTASLNWAICGPGNIAGKFAEGLTAVSDASLYSVVSRDPERARAFADQHRSRRIHATLDDMLADPQVDVVYIATPHTAHCRLALQCLAAGKPVLCEKPLAVNAQQAQQMIDTAQANNVFCMEAMWTRFFPLMRRLVSMLHDNVIGDLRMVQADFGFRGPDNPEHRLLNPALAGGGLLDVGIYPLSLLVMLMGTPVHATGLAHIGNTGVDEQCTFTTAHTHGRLGLGAAAVRTATPQTAAIMGTEGRILIHSPWWKPQQMTLQRPGKNDQRIDCPITGNGYNYQAIAVAEALAHGWCEHPIMPHDESLALAQTMDQLRHGWHLQYPCESSTGAN